MREAESDEGRPHLDVPKLAALAAAIEALADGHARVLAKQLRTELEAAGSRAEVISLAGRRTRKPDGR